MQSSTTCTLVALAALATGSSAEAAVTLISENFNAGSAVTDQASFATVFNVWETGGSQSWTHQAAGGVNGTGSLQPNVNNNSGGAVHKSGFAGFGTYSTLTYEVETKLNTPSVNAFNDSAFYGSLRTSTSVSGNETNLTNQLAGSLWFGLVYKEPDLSGTGTTETTGNESWQIQANGQVLATLNSPYAASNKFPANGGDWYRWNAAWTRDQGGLFDLTLTLSSIGDTGTSTASQVGQWTLNDISVAGVSSASTLYAGMNGRLARNAVAARVDNLSVVGVPEPSALGLLALAMPLVRRRAR
jgi:hypothetical protein